jgi:DNA repair protein RadC
VKTPTNQVRQNRNAARTSPQVKTKTPAAPGEFKIVRMRDCPVDSPIINTPPEVVDFWRKHVVAAPWFKDDKECLCVFLLNVHHRLLGFELVSQGTSDTVLMHPREVLRPAAIHNAAAIIIAHNHPSGEPSPSEGDIKATRALILAAEHLKIGFLDHIIIGDARRKDSFVSLRELGYFVDDDPALVPELLTASSPNISKAGRAAIDALDLLKISASAAIALATMNANKIKDCSAANAGWEDFDSASIQAGILELPRLLADQLESELSAWRDEVNQVVQKLAQPEKAAAGRGFLSHNTETAVSALNHLIELQGDEISNRHKNGAFATSHFITVRLQAAFDNAWAAWRKLAVSVRANNPERIPQAA